MMNDEVKIRFASMSDVPALLQIYKPYVLETAITFEYEVPSEEEFAKRLIAVQKKYPYLVAVNARQQNDILGYAYVSSFKERAAYDWAVETSIYIKQNQQKLGIGRKLYQVLEMVLKEMNITNLNACIAYPSSEDIHLTKNSVEFHRHLGYSLVGEFHQCGYKFDTWYNMVWMEKMIGEHQISPRMVLNVNEIKGRLESIL